ncbi:MAG: hypothetical protein GY748_19590 [Planctomycetaceae bacterium]|nr:hypothetical protein [Planctomycetaceae bacterium]
MSDSKFHINTHPLPRAMVNSVNHHLAVSCTFEWTGVAADGKEEFESFFQQAQSFEYGLFVIDKDAGTLTPVSGFTAISAPARDLDYQRFTDWLAARSQGDEVFWTTKDRAGTVTVSSSDLKAADALRPVADWTGPVAHDGGLAQLFDLGREIGDLSALLDTEHKALVVVPFASGNVPIGLVGITLVNNNDAGTDVTFKKPISFTYDMDQDGNVDVTFVGLAMRDDALFVTPDLALVDENTGLINLSENAQQVARILDQYRPFCNERHTLLHPMLDYLSSDSFVKAVTAATDGINNVEKPVIDAVMLAAAMTLDPLILTLLMPSVEHAEGGLLSHLIDALMLAHKVEHENPEHTTEVRDALNNIYEDNKLDDADDVLLASLRSVLDMSKLLAGAKPKEFAEAWSELGVPSVGDNLIGRIIAIMDPRTVTPEAIADMKLRKESDLEKESDREFTDRLVAEFGDYAIDFASESGLERTALAVVKSHLGDLSGVLLKRSEAAAGYEEATGVAIRRFVNAAFVAFDQLLNSSFNGSEAVRQSVAALFSHAITLPGINVGGENEGIGSVEDINCSLDVNVFYEARLGSGVTAGNSAATAAQIAMAETLWRPAPKNTKLKSELKNFDDAALTRFKEEILSARFVPDSMAKPLAIQLGLAAKASEMELFTDNYSGIGALLRVEGEADWSCLNMAQLEWSNESGGSGTVYPSDDDKPFVETLQPLVSNGLTNSFIGYDGIPFTSQIYAKTAVESETNIAFAPLFTIDTVPNGGAITKVPELAYGIKYELAEFAVAKGGVLPRVLRHPDDPWLLTAPEAAVTTKQTIKFQRRTGFARPNIEESTKSGYRRLGHIPSDVFPLSHDYPREVLGASQIQDFQRGPQGKGLLALKAGESEEILISAVRAVDTAADGKLKISLHTDPTTKIDDKPDAKDVASIDINKVEDGGGVQVRFSVSGAETHVHFEVRSADGNKLLARKASTIVADAAFFVRFSTNAAISYDSTDRDGLASENAGKDQPLLLLASDDLFANDLVAPVLVKVDHPAVSLTDFERWLANPVSAKTAGSTTNVSGWLTLLRKASIIKDADEELADALNRLPDLAVGGLLVQLIATDNLLGEAVNPQPEWLPQPELPDVPKMKGDGDLAQQFKDAILYLRLSYSHILKIQAGTSVRPIERATNVDVTLPEGQTATLAISLAVESHLIGSGKPLHAGFSQLATGTYNHQTKAKENKKYLLFAGPGMALEAMLPGLPGEVTARLNDRIEIRPNGRARRYDLAAKTVSPAGDDSGFNNIWRLVAQIDVHTQRWIPSGRPIYQFIAPRKLPSAGDKPIVPVPNGTDNLALFEGQAFFDRGPNNEQIVTHRVPPLAGESLAKKFSLITSVSWDEPTATYYRHRYTIRSRYAGAHNPDQKSADLFERESWKEGEDLWLNRVAVLADAARLEMTRPQQRAIIPTHHGLDADANNETVPPLVSTLQEPPFAIGGLADRIVADIVIGPGYHFADGDEQVSIQDLRKEIGKDPRLAQDRMTTAQAAGLVLEVEGNMGLTFDDIGTSSAAFSNTAMALLPKSVANHAPRTDFSETHIASRLFRYFDPDWTLGEVPGTREPDEDLEVPGEPIWIEITKKKLPGLAATLRFTGTDDTDIDVVSLAAAGDDWVVRFDVSFIDPTMSQGTYVELCRISGNRVERLIFVHAPISATQNQFMVLAAQKSDDCGKECRTVGSGNQPILLASTDWSNVTRPTKDAGNGTPKKRLKSKPPKLFGASQTTTSTVFLSAPTFAEWARTGKNFDALHGVHEDGIEQTFDAKDLSALVDSNDLYFIQADDEDRKPVWLRPQQQGERFAQHVHRHNMAVIIAPPEGLNHAPPIFQSAVSLDRQKISLYRIIPFDRDTLPENAQCVILELESAARPLSAGLPVEAEQMEDTFCHFEIHLDPISLTTNQPPDLPKEGLTFFGRFLTKLGEADKLTITLAGETVDDPKIDVEVDKPVEGWGEIVAFELDILAAVDGNRDVECRLITRSGVALKDHKPLGTVSGTPHHLAISVAPNTEAWFDVSMRTRHKDMTELLNVWLFGPTVASRETGEPRTMEQDLEKKTLPSLTEAQVRIVSFSPRINITKIQG